MNHATKTIALTGATGFVGRHVLPMLVEQGYEVRVLVRDGSRLATSASTIHKVHGDLFDADALLTLVDGADAVIHLVGIIMEDRRRGQTFQRVHTSATINLLEAAKLSGSVKRWIHMSALGVRPHAASQYHATKWEAEQALRRSGLNFTVFRPSIIHGVDGEFMQMVKAFWCKLFPPFVPYFGAGPFGLGGAGQLQPVWVDDVARCFVDALDNKRSEGETYPMGGPGRYTWPDLYRTVKEHLDCAKNKPVVAIPAWKAKILAALPGTPFNVDQVIMSQEESTCDTKKVEQDFGITLASFEEKLADYAARIE